MTVQQALAFGVIITTVAVFASGRFRYDLTALGALLAGIALGIVRPSDAFTGFTSDVVVIIAAALVISAAIAKSGVVEMTLSPLLDRLRGPASQVPVLAGATALLSIPTKNVGALAILMPTALHLARRTGSSPARLLMPMAFMSLLGGLVTLVGTSTNIIVSQVREEMLGKSFAMFDFAPVGLVLTALGLIFVSFAWRILPKDRQGRPGLHGAVEGAVYSTEATVPEQWPEGLDRVADLKLGGDGVTLIGLVSQKERKSRPLPDAPVRPGDLLVLEGEPENIDKLFARLPLAPAREDKPVEKSEASEEMRSIEAVIQLGSPLVGASAQRVRLQQAYGVNLLAVGRSGERITERLRDVVLRAGDLLVLQAGEHALPGALRELGVLPLAERDVRLGGAKRRFSPIVILAIAMVLVAVKIVPVAPAFFGAAVLMAVTGALSMREAYEALDAQVLVLIGALTPLSEAVRRTGGTDLVASHLALSLHAAPPLLALGALMVTAMACSPFLHNAPTVLVLGPIGALLAQRLHLNPDSFLMAVATGAGCDFLTPVGHQCNTLVMGPGGYKFSDYWKLGLPLSILVIGVGAPLIAWVWPLAAPH
jgi:di/tricarboxylate transporter